MMSKEIIDGFHMVEPEILSKEEREEIFEIASDIFTPLELVLLFGWKTEVED